MGWDSPIISPISRQKEKWAISVLRLDSSYGVASGSRFWTLKLNNRELKNSQRAFYSHWYSKDPLGAPPLIPFSPSWCFLTWTLHCLFFILDSPVSSMSLLLLDFMDVSFVTLHIFLFLEQLSTLRARDRSWKGKIYPSNTRKVRCEAPFSAVILFTTPALEMKFSIFWWLHRLALWGLVVLRHGLK